MRICINSLGHESTGRSVQSAARRRHLRESIEEREADRPGAAAGEAGRQDLLAVPVLLVPRRGALPAEHVQPILR